jgi:hypothetical protein
MTYKVALLTTAEGHSVSVPGLPGCWSQGATEEEALLNTTPTTGGQCPRLGTLTRHWPAARLGTMRHGGI